MSITHSKVSSQPDSGDAALVQPSDWNDDHAIVGLSEAATSFPSPTTGMRVFRTDLRKEFFYDGTRWLTTTLYVVPMAGSVVSNVSATGGGYLRATFYGPDSMDIWIEDVLFTMYASSLSGSAYWTVDVLKRTQADTTASLGTANNLSGTNAEYLPKTITVDAALGAYIVLDVTVTKTSTPGNLTVTNPLVTYRLIGT